MHGMRECCYSCGRTRPPALAVAQHPPTETASDKLNAATGKLVYNDGMQQFQLFNAATTNGASGLTTGVGRRAGDGRT